MFYGDILLVWTDFNRAKGQFARSHAERFIMSFERSVTRPLIINLCPFILPSYQKCVRNISYNFNCCHFNEFNSREFTSNITLSVWICLQLF